MSLMFIVKISSGGSVDIGQLTGPPIRYTPRHGLEHHQQVQQVEPAHYNTTYYYPSTQPQPQLYIGGGQYGVVPESLVTPPVQFVPYYYYYPVPDTPDTTQPDLQHPNNAISTSSCDSSIKVKRRKKKKKVQEKAETEVQFQDIDSGYFNGPDSSSELSSDPELSTDRG